MIMIRTISFLTIFFLFASGLKAQDEKAIVTGIKHVTVYPDRAQIDREASLTISAGKSLLKFSGLSPYIDMQSVQVKGFGNFVILSVNHQNNYLQNLEDTPEVKALKGEIESLKQKVEDENASVAVLKEKADFLRANQSILVKSTSFSIDQFKSVIDLYTNNMDQISISRIKKQRLIKDYETRIAALQQQLSDKLNRQHLPAGEILVTVQAERQVQGKLDLSYVVSNAGWYPSYDIRVEDINNPVSIVYKANVFQNSGIEWKEAKLSFSNASPWLSGNVPVLSPWFIDFYTQPAIMIRGVTSFSKKSEVPATAAADNYMNKVRENAPEAARPVVNKRIGETTVIFDVSEPYTVEADGKIRTVEIQSFKTQALYKYVSVPKMAPIAYLTANITDWSQLNLQNGEATLYFENSFVGKSSLNVNEINDTLAVSLGPDNSIVVKREKRKDFTSRKTIGSNKTETFSYILSVRNNKTNMISITMKDQLPVSSNSAIVVEPVELSGGKLDSHTGIVSWELSVKPGETKDIEFGYSVKYPKDKELGLNFN